MKLRQMPNYENRFEVIKAEVSKTIIDNNYIVLGDMNGRVGLNDDGGIFDGINNDHLPVTAEMGISTMLRSRQSSDNISKLDTHGRHIIDLCKDTGLRILNGRKFGDVRGNLTCFTPRGNSVVDYALADHELFNKIGYFTVDSKMNGLSDHCKIELLIRCTFDRKSDQGHKHKMPPKIKWNEPKKTSFLNMMIEPEMVDKLSSLKHNIEMKMSNINDNSNCLLDIFNTVMKRVFPLRKKRSVKKKMV